MATEALVQQPPKLSLAAAIAADYGMEVAPFISAIKSVVFPAQDAKGNPPTEAQLIAYLSVCRRYRLDPFVKQLWPFPSKNGGFIPCASYDGWIHIVNNEEQFDGDEYEEILDEKGNILGGEIKVYRKDRKRPITKKCWLSEWKRNTPNWNDQTRHMLELRTRSQGYRLAFNISGIVDEDEAAWMDARNITSESQEIERQSLSKTETLKEKIASKKAAATPQPEPPAPSAPAAPEPPKAPEPKETISPFVQSLSAMDQAKENMRKKAEQEAQAPPPTTTVNGTGSLFTGDDTADDPDRMLTKEEYQALLSILQTKCLVAGKLDKERENAVTKAARQKFMEFGAANSKQLRLRDYPAVMTWAQSLTV